MRFSMLPTQLSPIGVDIGSSCVKVLQVTTGEAPRIQAAAELEIPDSIRHDLEKRYSFLESELPSLIRGHDFRGKRIVCSPLATQVLVQMVQVDRGENDESHLLAAAQLEAQLECAPGSLVVRSIPVVQSMRDAKPVNEMLCFAMAREDSMRYVDLFKTAKCTLVGMHSQVRSIISAFDHLNRRSSDATVCTMYVDLGWGGMKIVVSHGSEMVFAKQVQIGGRQLDKLVSEGSGCDVFTARMRRIAEGMSDVALQSTARDKASTNDGLAMLRAGISRSEAAINEGGSHAGNGMAVATDRRSDMEAPELSSVTPADGPVLSGGVDCTELMESMSDELTMSARYHASLFGGRRIDRVVFLGGESRSTAMCRLLAQSLNVSAQLGDPLARYADGPNDQNLPEPGQASPSWAVACGLCTAPVDL